MGDMIHSYPFATVEEIVQKLRSSWPHIASCGTGYGLRELESNIAAYKLAMNYDDQFKRPRVRGWAERFPVDFGTRVRGRAPRIAARFPWFSPEDVLAYIGSKYRDVVVREKERKEVLAYISEELKKQRTKGWWVPPPNQRFDPGTKAHNFLPLIDQSAKISGQLQTSALVKNRDVADRYKVSLRCVKLVRQHFVDEAEYRFPNRPIDKAIMELVHDMPASVEKLTAELARQGIVVPPSLVKSVQEVYLEIRDVDSIVDVDGERAREVRKFMADFRVPDRQFKEAVRFVLLRWPDLSSDVVRKMVGRKVSRQTVDAVRRRIAFERENSRVAQARWRIKAMLTLEPGLADAIIVADRVPELTRVEAKRAVVACRNELKMFWGMMSPVEAQRILHGDPRTAVLWNLCNWRREALAEVGWGSLRLDAMRTIFGPELVEEDMRLIAKRVMEDAELLAAKSNVSK